MKIIFENRFQRRAQNFKSVTKLVSLLTHGSFEYEPPGILKIYSA